MTENTNQGLYGEIFNSPVVEIDFNDIIKASNNPVIDLRPLREIYTMKENLITLFGYFTFQIGTFLVTSKELEMFGALFNVLFLIVLFLWLRPRVLSMLNQEHLGKFYQQSLNVNKNSYGALLIGRSISKNKDISNDEAKEKGSIVSSSIMVDLLALSICMLPVCIYRLFT